MKFINASANIILLSLILVAGVGLVIATIYFENRLTSINDELGSKQAELQNLQEERDRAQTHLDSLLNEVDLRQSREQQLTAKFQEKETLLSQTQKNLDTALQEREQANVQRDQLLTKVGNLEQNITALEDSVNSWRNRYYSCDSEKDTIQDQLTECQGG